MTIPAPKGIITVKSFLANSPDVQIIFLNNMLYYFKNFISLDIIDHITIYYKNMNI